jgi:magnesium chelatase family protein
MNTAVKSLIDYGTRGLVVDIECHISNNLPNIVIVGFANRAVDEARERVRGAFASCGIDMPRKRITINLAPADIPKDSCSFDLPIAAAIILTADQKSLHPSLRPLQAHEAVMGELGLDGSVRPVRGIIGKILAGRKQGFTTFYIPENNFDQAQLITNVKLIPLKTLQDFMSQLSTKQSPVINAPILPVRDVRASWQEPPEVEINFSDIIGQEQAKRALQIAAAGGHNILLDGPPGTGKSMLAKALPSILPDLTTEEMLEVTHLYSLASKDYSRIITTRPFRAPHHTASQAAIVGGGSVTRPGEISLAHHGVLFFDEFPEFRRTTIEALRQPLEDHSITIARAHGSLDFPASFILVATSNPCPCGYFGTPRQAKAKQCICSINLIRAYRAKLSGPILDRIDLYVEVPEIDHAGLLSVIDPARAHEETLALKQQIAAARDLQKQRFQLPRLNSGMANRDIARHGRLQPDAKQVLDRAAQSLNLSPRAYMRTIKVARTIADLEDSEDIKIDNITEALQYRQRSVAG